MFRTLSVCLILTGALMLSTTSAIAAGPVERYTLSFSEDSEMALDEELAACVGYAGTVVEERQYDVQVTEFVGGPRQGRIHLTGVVLGEFVISPDPGETGPTYTGDYREKLTFIGTSFDDPLVASFTLPVSAAGSDGSRLKFLMHGHIVVGQDGEVRLMNFKFHCIS